jgi:hypothetical protein
VLSPWSLCWFRPDDGETHHDRSLLYSELLLLPPWDCSLLYHARTFEHYTLDYIMEYHTGYLWTLVTFLGWTYHFPEYPPGRTLYWKMPFTLLRRMLTLLQHLYRVTDLLMVAGFQLVATLQTMLNCSTFVVLAVARPDRHVGIATCTTGIMLPM